MQRKVNARMETTILSKGSIAEDILGELVKHAQLPEEGFLAGGAVANTILKLEYGGDFPIKDLDIFQKVNNGPPIHCSTPCRDTELELLFHYGWIRLYAVRKYRVIGSANDGMLNTIDIAMKNSGGDSNGGDPYSEHKVILGGFDLNCCQAGIDLKEGS